MLKGSIATHSTLPRAPYGQAYHQLYKAILLQCRKDSTSADDKLRTEALKFISSPDAKLMAAIVGIT